MDEKSQKLWEQAVEEHFPHDTLLVLADSLEDAGDDMAKAVRAYVRCNAAPYGAFNGWCWTYAEPLGGGPGREELGYEMGGHLRPLTRYAVEGNAPPGPTKVWYRFDSLADAVWAWLQAYTRRAKCRREGNDE